MQQPSTSTPSRLSPRDIQRRLNDIDEQIRQGLEDGTVRQVMKRVGPLIKELMEYQRAGTVEEKAAFPRRLFLYDFLRSWNKPDLRHAGDFVDRQLRAVLAFDATSPSPVPPAPHRPPKRARTPEALQAGPSNPKPTTKPNTTARVEPDRLRAKVDDRAPGRAYPQVPRPLSSLPPPVGAGPPKSQRRLEVEIPPRKFRDIAKDSEEEEDDGDVVEVKPKPKPKDRLRPDREPPRSQKTKSKADPDPESDPSPPRRRRPQPGPEPDPKKKIRVNTPPCAKCARTRIDCIKNPKRGACLPCKKHKYGCEYSQRGKRIPGDDDDEDDLEDEHESEEEEDGGVQPDSDPEEPLPPAKRKGKVAEAGTRIKKERTEAQAPSRPKVSKSVKKGKGVQFDVEEEEVKPKKKRVNKGKAIEVDDEEEEPRAKRARLRTYSTDRDFGERMGNLEAKVALLAEESKNSQQLATRLTGLEKNIERFTDVVGNFLGQIRIDDGVRLVRDDRRISDLSLNFDPDKPLEAAILDMDMDMAFHTDPGSPAPESMSLDSADDRGNLGDDTPMLLSPVEGTATTPSEIQDEERMERVGLFPLVSPNPTTQPDSAIPPPPVPEPDSAMLPPPPPTVNVIPATPQHSQDAVEANRLGVPPPATSSEMPVEPGPIVPPIRARSRPRSRTPLATTSGLQPPITRSRSRSKTPA